MVGGHIFHHHCPGSYHTAMPDCYSLQDYSAKSYPAAILNCYRSRQDFMAQAALGAGTNSVGAGINFSKWSYRYVITDSNGGIQVYRYMSSYDTIIRNFKIAVKIGVATQQFQVAHNKTAIANLEPG